tara:strand:+ start:111 stop:347 length:237 start_codon:yes stop_codon:yes gene_type:complete
MLDYRIPAMKFFSVLLAMIALGLWSCERHEWESKDPKSSDTINLFKHGEGHKHSQDKKDGEHTKSEGDEEKKSADAHK